VTRPAEVERRQRRARLDKLEKNMTRIGVALVVAAPVLGMGAGALGAAEVYPYEYALPVALAAMGAPIGIALLIGASGGLYIMGGGRVAPLGVVFVAGFAALVVGIAGQDESFRDLGVVLLAGSGAVFHAVGVASGGAPEAVVASWGNVGSIAAGVVAAVTGRAVDAWAVMLFGAMAAGCGFGAIAGRWWVRRAAGDGGSETAVAPASDADAPAVT
jgi:hypothetical protein